MQVDKATAVLSRIQSRTTDAFSSIEFRSSYGKLFRPVHINQRVEVVAITSAISRQHEMSLALPIRCTGIHIITKRQLSCMHRMALVWSFMS
jgi:hypothetical protein